MIQIHCMISMMLAHLQVVSISTEILDEGSSDSGSGSGSGSGSSDDDDDDDDSDGEYLTEILYYEPNRPWYI